MEWSFRSKHQLEIIKSIGVKLMLFVLTIIVSFIASLLFKNTRIIGALGFISLAWLAGTADERTTTDYAVYKIHFNSIGYEVSPFEKGYTVMSAYFSHIGFDYAEFRLLFVFLAFTILFFGVTLFTKNVAMFTWIYGITVFFNDATQTRNLMMISMVILGSAIFLKFSLIGKCLGILLILFSSQFHDLGFLFILIIPIFLINEKILKKIEVWIISVAGIILMFVTIFGNSILQRILVKFLTSFSSRNDSASNVQNNFSRGTSISIILLIWITVLLVLYLSNKFISSLSETQKIRIDQLKMLYSGIFISIITLFLIVMSPDYSRISRNAFLFFIILATIYITDSQPKSNLFKHGRILFVLSLILVTYTHTMIWGPDYQNSIAYIAKLKNSNIISGD
ncbi:EpsG family protein [Leuconostoc mesenteroides]|uniref:EpsG family protein n=2 Tax=Leuconostoc mesenteroides TaxID=1245 RepID=UPI000CF89459|nr:EpsG family protein [Leuconostoc mesenteroides]KAA8348543.1 EpsG family protein [Leuconostoc mesenteroides]